jgi:hypothetical protein
VEEKPPEQKPTGIMHASAKSVAAKAAVEVLTGEGPPQDGFGIQKTGGSNVYMREPPTL